MRVCSTGDQSEDGFGHCDSEEMGEGCSGDRGEEEMTTWLLYELEMLERILVGDMP